MTKSSIFFALLSTFIATSWCKNGRYTPFKTAALTFRTIDAAFKADEAKAKAKQEKTEPKKEWKAWNYPVLSDLDDLYQLENVMTATAYADGTKAKKVPFGCFLSDQGGLKDVAKSAAKGAFNWVKKKLKKDTAATTNPIKTVLGEMLKDDKKKGEKPWIAQLEGKSEKDLEKSIDEKRTIPFLVNVDSKQKYKLIYVKADDDIKALKGLEEVKVYQLRHTLFGEDSKVPSKEFARFSPLKMEGVATMSFNEIKTKAFDDQETKAKAKQKKEKPNKEWKDWKWPEVKTLANLYLLENTMTATAYADGTKAKKVPFGCFLDKATEIKGEVKAKLKLVELKGYTEGVDHKPGRVPFMVNYPEQKYRVMYVNPNKDLTKIPGLDKLKVYLFRHSVINAPKKTSAYQVDAGDDYYDDSDYYGGYFDGEYYQNDYYYDDQGGYYDLNGYYYDDNGYYEDEDQYYEYNGGNQYGRNGLYRLMRAYRNGLYQN